MLNVAQPIIEYTHSGVALNGGAAITVITEGTYVSVATGLSKRALCYIKVQNVTGGVSQIIVRDKDESGDWEHSRIGESGGVAKYYCDLNKYGAVIVPCNASGDIEITANGNNKDWKLWLMGFIPSI